MAASVPTVAAVMLKSFDRPKIVDALERFGVRADPRKCGKALKVQLFQLVHDQTPGNVVCDGMLVDGAPAHTPAAAAATAPGAKPSTASEGLLAPRRVGRGIHGRRHPLLGAADDITFSVRWANAAHSPVTQMNACGGVLWVFTDYTQLSLQQSNSPLRKGYSPS
jgi:hypothetical protein